MSAYQFFTPGLDPTTLPGVPTNSQLLQMWQQGKFASGAGCVVWSAAAPDVVTYPDLALCVWGQTSGGIPTGLFYTYNGTLWTGMKLVPGTLDADSFANGTLPISKLVPGTALYVLRTNSAGNGLEWVLLSSAIANNTITAAQLQNAAGSGFILRSGTGGVYAPVLLQSAVDNLDITYTKVKDVASTAQPTQVLAFAATGGYAYAAYADVLLRDGQVSLSKLNLGGSPNAGKLVKINATGTGFDYIDQSSLITAAYFYDTVASGVAAQAVLANTLTTLRLSNEGTLPSWTSVASDAITLAAGTYDITAIVPIYETSGDCKGIVGWYNAVPTLIRSVTAAMTGDQDMLVATLQFRLTVTATTTYTLKAQMSKDFAVGRPAGIASVSEVYTQLRITKVT